TFLADRPIAANHLDRPGRKLRHRNPAKIDDGRSERGNIRPIIPAQYTEVIGSDVIVIHLDYQAAGVNDRNRTAVLKKSPQGGIDVAYLYQGRAIAVDIATGPRSQRRRRPSMIIRRREPGFHGRPRRHSVLLVGIGARETRVI